MSDAAQRPSSGPSRQRITQAQGLLACVSCKKQKMKCVRPSGAGSPCERCGKVGRECVTEPPGRPGRIKGIPNKPKQIPPASASDLPVQPASSNALVGPSALPAVAVPPQISYFAAPPFPSTSSAPSVPQPSTSSAPASVPASFSFAARSPGTESNTSADMRHLPPEQLAQVSNPLSLLAAVSDDKRTDNGATSTFPSPGHQAEDVADLLKGVLDPRLAALRLDLQGSKASLLTVMAPRLGERSVVSPPASHRRAVRDLHSELNPVHLGLVSESEVMLFFHTFFSSLHPLNPTLCPLLHSPPFVRARSFYLFSVILYIGALYTHDSAPASKRLRFHVEKLSQLIVAENLRSVEIVQAHITYLCWKPPPLDDEEDRVWLYTTLSLSMALDLHLDRPIPSEWAEQLQVLEDDLVGQAPETVDTELLGRLVRNRERTWLRLFLWYSAFAVSSGNPAAIPDDDLLRNAQWYKHPLASPYDRITCTIVELRRSFISLSLDIKYRLQHRSPEGTAWIAPFVDAVLDPWKERWLPTEHHHDNYLRLIHRHGRLWCLSAGLSPEFGTPEERQPCIDACLTAALECCKEGLADLRAPNYLWYLTNSGAVMLAYSASLALRLFSPRDGSDASSSHAALLGLIASFSLTLEQVGTTPPHRFGLTALYGRQLQKVVRRRAFALRKSYQLQDDSLLLPQLDDLVMSSMSGFVDNSWDLFLGGGATDGMGDLAVFGEGSQVGGGQDWLAQLYPPSF